MKNIKLFEEFSTNDKMDEVRIPKGNLPYMPSGYTPTGTPLPAISLDVEGENPDLKLNFKVTGVGKDPKEAATIALGTAWGVLHGGVEDNSSTITLSDAIAYLEEHSDGNWQSAVDSLVRAGDRRFQDARSYSFPSESIPGIEPDYFSNHGMYTSFRVTFSKYDLPVGGYVKRLIVNEEY